MFFITTLIINNGKLQGSRCIGYYKEKNVAIDAVHNNAGDMCEYMYNYVAIEHLEEGIYPHDIEPLFFKWNEKTKKYDKVDRPEELKNSYAFGIG